MSEHIHRVVRVVDDAPESLPPPRNGDGNGNGHHNPDLPPGEVAMAAALEAAEASNKNREKVNTHTDAKAAEITIALAEFVRETRRSRETFEDDSRRLWKALRDEQETRARRDAIRDGVQATLANEQSRIADAIVGIKEHLATAGVSTVRGRLDSVSTEIAQARAESAALKVRDAEHDKEIGRISKAIGFSSVAVATGVAIATFAFKYFAAKYGIALP